MSRKRASLRDKNVFKKSKEGLDTLLDSTSPPKEEAGEKQAAKTKAKRTPRKTPPVSSPADETPAVPPKVETPLPEDDLIALADEALWAAEPVSATTPAAEMPDTSPDTLDDEIGDMMWDLDEPFDFLDAVEASSSAQPVEAMPSGEMGDAVPNVDDSLGFSPAMETPPGGSLTEDMPTGEIGDAVPDVDDSLGFAPAMKAPPGDHPIEDMPAGEMGDAVFDVDDSLGFPPAMDAPDGSAAANGSTDTAPPQDDVFGFSPALESPLEESYADYFAAEMEEAAKSQDDFAPPAESQAMSEPPETPPTFTEDFDFINSALAEEPTPISIPAESAIGEAVFSPAQPVSSIASSPIAETSAVAASETPPTDAAADGPVVSRMTRLSIAGDDMSDDPLRLDELQAPFKATTLEIPEYILEDLTPEERKKRVQQLKDPRIREQFMQTYNAIDAEYEHILSSDVSVNEKITNELQNLLGETRYITTNYQVQFLAKAEWNIEQVRARLDRAEVSAKKAIKWGPSIIIWGILWFFISVFFIFKPDFLLKFLTSTELVSDLLAADIFLRALFFGAIGGVTAVFYYFLRSVASREFDPQFVTSYFTKPFMGMTLATMIYLLVFVFMRLFNIIPGNLEPPADGNATIGQSNSLIFFMTLTWVLSLASGFQEHVAFNLLRKTIKKIMGDSNAQDDAEVSPPPPGPFSPETNSSQ